PTIQAASMARRTSTVICCPAPETFPKRRSSCWSGRQRMALTEPRARARCAPTRRFRLSPMRYSMPLAYVSITCRLRPSAYYAHSGRNVRRDRTASLSRPPVTSSSEALAERFRQEQYIADDGLATAMFLALRLGKPLLLEGAPGVGKTEAAKVLAAVLDCELVRLQCYEGIDAAHALYEWNYQRQLLAIRQAGESEIDIYDDRFLIARPLLQVLQAPSERVLLIDEIDRSDHEFEALLLEFLSDFQITIPERGTIAAARRPIVVLTSNRTRELAEALRRRCVYHWIGYPDAEREAAIIMARAGDV